MGRVKIMQDTETCNYVYAIHNDKDRDGISLHTRKTMLRWLGDSTWRVQLLETDGTYNPDSEVYHTGNDPAEVLRQITPDWGIWVLTEISPWHDGTAFANAFNFSPRQYRVSLKFIL